MFTMTTKGSTRAAIRDVLERTGSLGDAPARPPLRARARRRLACAPRRRMVLAACAVAVVPAGVAVEDAAAEQDFRPALASWYGPGLWGNPLGCGGTLRRGTVGVAHKTMACGRTLRFCLHRCATARVVDRGPYVGGREFDLTEALAGRIGFQGVGRIFVRVVG